VPKALVCGPTKLFAYARHPANGGGCGCPGVHCRGLQAPGSLATPSRTRQPCGARVNQHQVRAGVSVCAATAHVVGVLRQLR
jgi:hypothetical protein